MQKLVLRLRRSMLALSTAGALAVDASGDTLTISGVTLIGGQLPVTITYLCLRPLLLLR
jgi:flagellar basal body rod protein FlgF